MAVNSHHLLIRNATQKKTPGILIISQFVEFRGKRLTAWSFFVFRGYQFTSQGVRKKVFDLLSKYS